MKTDRFFLFCLAFAVLITSGCSSLGKKESPVPELLPDGWQYEIEITHEGSRSEGSVGRLYYDGNELSPRFDLIAAGRTVFEYIPMVHLWDNSGYRETYVIENEAAETSTEITSDEICTGWYSSDLTRIKKSTPESWVYAESGGKGFRAAPDKLEELADLNDFKSRENADMMIGPSIEAF